MQVILTTEEEHDVWMRAAWDEAEALRDPYLMTRSKSLHAGATRRTYGSGMIRMADQRPVCCELLIQLGHRAKSEKCCQ